MLWTVIAVVGGFVLWSVIWLGGNAALRVAGFLPPEGQQVAATNTLVALLLLGVVASISSGYLANRIAGGKAPIELAILLLVVGAAVQFQLRNLMPIWYHAIFLLLIVPATLVGGRLP